MLGGEGRTQGGGAQRGAAEQVGLNQGWPRSGAWGPPGRDGAPS